MSFKYPDAVIYRIKCFETLNYYIGSTVNLERRMYNHKQKDNDTASIFIIKTGNYKIKILEKYPCNIKNEMFPTEQKHLDRYRGKYGDLVLNKNNPFPTKEQKREKNRINYKKFYELNKEKLNETKRETKSKKFDCECGRIYRRADKARHLRTKIHQKYISKINENKI